MYRKIVITGADGFIGSHLSKYLAREEDEVYAIVIPKSPIKDRITNVAGIHIIEGDMNSYETLVEHLPKNPDAFIHFAWAGVAPEDRKSIEVQKSNLDLTMNAIKLAATIESAKFVFPGSTFEYIYSEKIINRYTTPSPQDAYGATKVAARYYSSMLCNQLNVPFVYAVISGIYAADRIDNNVINYSITKLLYREKPSVTKLEQLWDYVHIDDVIHALDLIIDSGKNGGFYVIGHGDNMPLANYIYLIRDLINPELPLGIGDVPYTSDKMPMSCVDLTEIHEDTGFVPQISFEKGIVDVIEKIREREGL